jgi:thiol-disulfide isomerase/thioredoxin
MILTTVAVAIVALVLSLRTTPRTGALHHPAVGKRLDSYTLDPLVRATKPLSDHDLLGRPTLINFWGPWCGYCLREFPELLPLEAKLRAEGKAQLILVSYDSNGRVGPELERESKETLERFKSDAPVYADPRGELIRSVIQAGRMPGFGFPTTVLLDRRGVIRGLWSGYDPGYVAEMEKALEQVAADG